MSNRPDDWRKTVYYHYYEYPGWHMVHRHEGVYDGRYKLLNFYDLDGWEFYDLESDPREMVNRYDNLEYAEVLERMRSELDSVREQYQVPENEKQDISNVDMRFHSGSIRKRIQSPMSKNKKWVE